MKKIKQIPESQMVLEFIKSELNSARFGFRTRTKALKVSYKHKVRANINSEKENRQRAKLLDATRGYLSRTLLFKKFPKRVKWFYVDFDFNDFKKFTYIKHHEWKKWSNNKYLLREGFEYIFQIENNKPPLKYVKSIYSDIVNKKKIPPIIVVTDIWRTKFVILEGSCRSTAYYKAFNKKKIKKVRAILGVSKNMPKWKFF